MAHVNRRPHSDSTYTHAYRAADLRAHSNNGVTPEGRPSEHIRSPGNAAVGSAGKVFRKPWYAFWKRVEKQCYAARTYSIAIPYGYRVFTPWFSTDDSSEFSCMVRSVRQAGSLCKSADRCYMLYQLSRSCLRFEGEWAECGVHRGGTAHLLSLVAECRPRRVHLFDTFSGTPSTALGQRDYHDHGDFADTSLALVQERLRGFPFVTFHTGELPATFDDVAAVDSYSFVHVDVGTYAAVMACCNWFWPRLCAGGMILFNDYGMYTYRYAGKAAVDEYFADVNDGSLIILPTGQGVAIKY